MVGWLIPPENALRVCIDHRRYKGQHEQEPLCTVSPANWRPLNNTGQKLLSQWVVIDFYLSDSSTFPLLSNEPAAPSFPAAPLIARWRYHSPSWPTECIEVQRSCISCQALLAVILTRRAIPFHCSFHSRVHSLPLSCRQMLCSSPLFYFQSGKFWFTWNWGHVGKTFLNRTFQPIWKVYIHLYVFQLCKVPFHRSSPATPPMLVFVLVAWQVCLCVCVFALLHRWTRCVACPQRNLQARSPQARRSQPPPWPRPLFLPHLLTPPSPRQSKGWGSLPIWGGETKQCQCCKVYDCFLSLSLLSSC